MWLSIPDILLASVVGWTCCKTLRIKTGSKSQNAQHGTILLDTYVCREHRIIP